MSKLGKFDVVGLLQEHGAILNGHFQIPTGFHTQTYIQPSMVLQYPHLAQKIAKEMAGVWGPERIETVVGRAEVKEVFPAGKHDKAAGLLVLEG